MSAWYQISNEQEVASPALLIYEERVAGNIERMIEIVGSLDRLRPHVKTHKLQPLVEMQMRRGIQKFKCATLAEAEMCARAGAPDILLAMAPVGPNIGRFCELVRKFPAIALSTVGDDAGAIASLGAYARKRDMKVEVLLDLDCGQHRTGVAAGPKAEQIYRILCNTPGIRPGGLHAYDGHIIEGNLGDRGAKFDKALDPVQELRKKLLSDGLPIPRLVAGGSPTFPFHAAKRDRECSPGTTLLWDFTYSDHFPDLPFYCAATVLTRVISKPGLGKLCLDLGHKAIAAENPHPRVRLMGLENAEYVVHSEEHLVLETDKADNYKVGDVLYGIPRHICPTVALYSEAAVVRAGAVQEFWPITARARKITV